MNLFEPATAAGIQDRLARVHHDSPRLWGKMTAPQALAHCSVVLEMAVGDKNPPRSLIGRLIGPMVKKLVTRNDALFGKNAPTSPEMVIADSRELEPERARLRTLIDRFAGGGRTGCTTNAHTFFGRMTPDEWSILMYKHLDHHLRQFSA
jgi:hypothetical protein